MRKMFVITLTASLLILTFTRLAVAQSNWKENKFTNQTSETLHVVFSTWRFASRNVPKTGYRTVGYYNIPPGGFEKFYGYLNHPIYLQIQTHTRDPIKPQKSTATVRSWLPNSEKRDGFVFNIVTPEFGTATPAQISFTSVPKAQLSNKDGFIKYRNGSQITVTDAWVPVSPEMDPNTLVNIPDPDLRWNIESELDKVKGAPITAAEMQKLTSFEDGLWDVEDLTGLEFATNLTELDLWSGTVSDVSPLAGLTNLTELSIADCKLLDISPLAGLTNLTELDLAGNNISDISPLAGLTNLEWLWLGYWAEGLLGNNISDISPLAGLTNLKGLYINANNISDISPLAELTNLTELSVDFNNISDISPLAGLTNLTRLSVNNLGIVAIPQKNNISDVSPLAGLTNLTYLNLSYNQISDISALSGLTNLTYLNLIGNSISDFSPIAGLIPNLDEYYNGDQKVEDPNTAVNIPDPALRAAIEKALGKNPGDPIPQADMLTLTELVVSEAGIEDLTGLAFAKNLIVVEFTRNQISDISALAGLTKLEALALGHNYISDISPLARLTNLTILILQYNRISDFSPIASLVPNLLLYENDNQNQPHPETVKPPKVETPKDPEGPIDAAPDPDYVYIPDDNLRAVVQSALGKEKVDSIAVVEMHHLTSIEAGDDGIKDLTGLEAATNLTELSLYGNAISDISLLSGLTNLTELSLSNNAISDISALAGLTNLTELSVANNYISDVSPIANFKNLTKLDISDNEIPDVSPLAGLTNLTELSVANNYISDVSPIANFKNLTKLDISDNEISDISPLAGLTNLTELSLANNEIPDISPLAGLTNLGRLDLTGNDISDISPLADMTNLRSLWISKNRIADFAPIEALISNLEVYVNKPQRIVIVRIPDPRLRAAIEEALGKTRGATINKADMQTLTTLTGTQGIENIVGLEFATNLKLLDLDDNQILDISALSGLTNLITLFLGDNQISDISALSDLTNLASLSLSNNQISDISLLSGLTNLSALYLDDNQISDISALSDLTNLASLSLSNNQISDISALSDLTNLTEVSLSNNQISDISALSDLTNLSALWLDDNQISDISALSGLTNLITLFLHNNNISDVSSLSGLSSLRWLYLDNNQISDISLLSGLTNLIGLRLPYNRIVDFAPIVELEPNLTHYVKSPQLKSLIPHAVEISGPTTVTSVVKDQTFTATVKNASYQGLGNVEVTINGGQTVRTNGSGAAEFKLNFPSVGTDDINVSVRSKETGTEFQRNFSSRVKVPEPASIELVKDYRQIQSGTYYTALFAVRSADDQPLEGFDVKMNVGQWVFEVIGTASIPILDALTYGRPIAFIPDVAPIVGDRPSPSMKEVYVRSWRVKSAASDRLNTGITDSEGKVICNQVLSSQGAYGVSATVLLNGRELLTTSFSANEAPNSKIITPAREIRSLEIGNSFSRVSGGWKRVESEMIVFPGPQPPYPPVDPPDYRVKVVPRVSCGTTGSSPEVAAISKRLAPQISFARIDTHGLTASTATVELYPDKTPFNSTTSLDPFVRWTPSSTRATDIGVTVLAVTFLDGTSDQKSAVEAMFRRWEPPETSAKLKFIFPKKDEFSDIRVTFDEENLIEARGNAVGRARLGADPVFVSYNANINALRDEHADEVKTLGDLLNRWGLQTAAEKAASEKTPKASQTLWVDPECGKNFAITGYETEYLHSVILHEIGHALGFRHTEGVGKILELSHLDSSHIDDYSIMHETAGQMLTLSRADKKAAANAYGIIPHSGWEVIEIGGDMIVYGLDDEPFYEANESIRRKMPLDIYVGPQNKGYEYVALQQFRWGGECRLEVDIGARGITEDSVEMAIHLRLFEGTSESTRDLDGEKIYKFLVGYDGILDEDGAEEPKWKRQFRVDNDDEGGDYAIVTLSLFRKIYPDPIIVETLPQPEDVPAAPTAETPNLVSASDINGDGQVDVTDLVLVSNHIGQSASANLPVDVNGDGAVTIADLVYVAQYLGQSTTASAPVNVVVPNGLTYETVEEWVDQARLEDDGSRVFHHGIAKLEYLLTLIIPEKTALLHNYPNPFNPETWIPYHLSKPAKVTLTIYAVDGKVVRRLDFGHQAAGFYQSKSRAAHWDGRNAVGERVASGIYFYTLTAGDFSATHKMLIRK